jgi:glucose 1-dehydrogenase
MQLNGKVALVTGSTSGIGKAIALRFLKAGANVAINYRPGGRHSGDKALVDFRQFEPNVIAIGADVSVRADVERMVGQVVQHFGALDIAVSNAGMQIQRPFLEVPDDEWHQVIAVNLYGSFVVSQLAARQMVQQRRGGKIIFMSSTHEDIPFVGYTAYCASKGGLRMLMRNLAMELAQHKINVNNIAPGAIATPINEAVLEDPEQKKNALTEIPWGRFGRAEEVASTALFLASNESDYVTGSTYYVDGGLAQQVTQY